MAEPGRKAVAAKSPDRQPRRGSSLWVPLGASLVLIGLGAVILSGSFDPAPTSGPAVSRDAAVNVGADRSGDISAHNSPTLVRNPVRPDNLAVSSRIDTPFYSCALHFSLNGGRSWSLTGVPAPKGEEAKCFAPDVAFSADGTLHLAFVTLKGAGNVPNAVWMSTSKDGGRTLSKPDRVRGPLAFQVRLAPDPAEPRRLYMTWLQGSDVAPFKFTETGNPIQVARTDDGGASWSRPVRVSDPDRERVIAASPAVGPEGELYALYLDLGDDRLNYAGGHGGRGGPPYRGTYELVLARSRDQGETWQESPVDDGLRAIERFIVFTPAFPSVAVDRSGRVYAAFHDNRLGDPDVFLWSLAAGESEWEGPTRVNDTAERDRTSQYLPKLAVAPDGRLDVLYYDRRADRRDIMNQVSLQSSRDDGRSFSRALGLSSRRFDSRIGYGAKEGLPDLGSRLGLLSDERRALGIWSDTRAGTPATQKQNLQQASVVFPEPRDRPSKLAEDGLRYGGIGVGLLGLLMLGQWVAGAGRLAARDG